MVASRSPGGAKRNPGLALQHGCSRANLLRTSSRISLRSIRATCHSLETRTRLASSTLINKNRGTMRLREERVDLVAFAVERQRVRARFRGNHRFASHRADIDHVDHSRVADRHVKAFALRVQENH